MTRYDYKKDTNFTLEYCYNNLLKFVDNLDKKTFAEIINISKQNLYNRLKKNSKLSQQELKYLRMYLIDNGIPTKMLNVAVVSDTMVQIPVRSEVELSCGTGTYSNADFVSDTIGLDINFIRSFGGNPKTVSVVYAKGDSMADKIESGDALIVDESKTYITNGKVYAFVYDSELYCKQLKKSGNEITAISFNKDYEPFVIDKSKQFSVVGQVISAMKRI